MKLRYANRGFTIIEVLVVLVFFPILFGASGFLIITSLRALNSSIEHADVRDDMTFATEKIVRDLKKTAEGGLSQYSSIAHTIEIDTVDGSTSVFYLYNASDTTLDSTYSESTYDLRRACTVPSCWTQIIYDEFETDFGNWTDGGTDCTRYISGPFAHQGIAAIEIQDNTSSSVMSTSDLDLSSYSQVLVEFWYHPRDLDGVEDFWLQISTNGGDSYSTVQTWVNGTDFTNGSFYEESVTITGYTLTDETRIRFRVDASGNDDNIYFDEVRVSASTGVTDSPSSGEGMLLLRDVVSPDATEPATDLTISGNEVTLDLVVQRGTETMTMRTKVRPRNL